MPLTQTWMGNSSEDVKHHYNNSITGMRRKRLLFAVTIWNIIFCSQVIGQELTETTDLPDFVEPITNVTTSVGREATLQCTVKNIAAYKVAWIKHDTQTLLTIHEHVISRDPRIRISHNMQKQWYLHIRDVNVDDKGQYMCQINTEPMISQLGYLDVMIPPTIMESETSSDTTAEERSKVSLKCSASGYPNPTISWRREDGKNISLGSYGGKKRTAPKVDSDYLNISQVTRDDMGAYLCIASNKIPPSVSKRIILQVNFRPKIRVPNQLIGAPAASSVSLECIVEASPQPLTSWIRSDGLLLLDGRKYRILEDTDSYRTNMRLKIEGLTEADFGSYKCVAKNSLGEKEGYIRLYETPPPTTTPRITTALNAGFRRNKVSERFHARNMNNVSAHQRKAIEAHPATNSLKDESQDYRTEKALWQSKKSDWSDSNEVTGRSYQASAGSEQEGSKNQSSRICKVDPTSLVTFFLSIMLPCSLRYI